MKYSDAKVLVNTIYVERPIRQYHYLMFDRGGI